MCECRYGACAVFNSDHSIKSIYSTALGQTVYPGDPSWDHAKWAWKTSLYITVTAGAHLTHLHWIVSNVTHIACRTCLGKNHPIRRVLKVFTFGTGMVNYNSTMALYPENALMYRIVGLTKDGLIDGFNRFLGEFKYETYPEYIASKRLSPEIERSVPMCTDGVPIWDAYRAFFTSYVDIYFTDDEAVRNDVELMAFWTCMDDRGGFGSPWKFGLPAVVTKIALIELLTYIAFQVTTWHELVGTVNHFRSSPVGLSLSIRPGKEIMDVRSYLLSMILGGFTSIKNPYIMSDWRHLFLKDEHAQETHQLHADLMDVFERLGKDVDSRNALAPSPLRPRATHIFNPKNLECSVSV